MGSILSIIGLIILAVLKLEQFVYGKSGKQQSTTGHMARRGLANLAGLIAFDYSTVSSKSVVTDAEARKRGEQTGLDTLVVHAVNDEC